MLLYCVTKLRWIDILRSRQNGRQLADGILKRHFIEEKKLSHFDYNFTEIRSRWSYWQHNSIGSGNGLALNMQEGINWTNDDHPWRHFAPKAIMTSNNRCISVYHLPAVSRVYLYHDQRSCHEQRNTRDIDVTLVTPATQIGPDRFISQEKPSFVARLSNQETFACRKEIVC